MEKLSIFWHRSDPLIVIPILISLVMTLLIYLTLLLLYSQLPNRLPLFYSLPWGQSQLIDKSHFYLLPLVLLSITVTNAIITSQLHPLQTSLKRILTISLIFISLITAITTIQIFSIFI